MNEKIKSKLAAMGDWLDEHPIVKFLLAVFLFVLLTPVISVIISFLATLAIYVGTICIGMQIAAQNFFDVFVFITPFASNQLVSPSLFILSAIVKIFVIYIAGVFSYLYVRETFYW